jgi:DNA modification methylase
MVAAMKADRNSIGVEIDPAYLMKAESRVHAEADQMKLFGAAPQLVTLR